MQIYIYIYIEREREREREKPLEAIGRRWIGAKERGRRLLLQEQK
jgi:hypothetical protein